MKEIWTATRLLFEIAGGIALVAWFSPGYLPPLLVAASIGAIALAWTILYRIVRYAQRHRLSINAKREPVQKRNTRLLRQDPTKHPLEQVLPEQPFISALETRPKRRFLGLDPDTGDARFKMELPGEA